MASSISLIVDGDEYYMKYENMEREGIFVIDYERTASAIINELEDNGKVDVVSLYNEIRECSEEIFEEILAFAVEWADNNEIVLR